MLKNKYSIAVIAGDGIGKEVMPEGIRCLETISSKHGINLDFKDIINYFRKNYIDARAVWHPNHLQRKFLKFQKYKIENAKKIVETSVCLPSSVNLGYKDQEKVVSLLKNLTTIYYYLCQQDLLGIG